FFAGLVAACSARLAARSNLVLTLAGTGWPAQTGVRRPASRLQRVVVQGGVVVVVGRVVVVPGRVVVVGVVSDDVGVASRVVVVVLTVIGVTTVRPLLTSISTTLLLRTGSRAGPGAEALQNAGAGS